MFIRYRNTIFKFTDDGDFTTLVQGYKSTEGIFAWSNGTLTISRADKSHEGRYLCEASNGIAAGVSKLVSINVNGQ